MKRSSENAEKTEEKKVSFRFADTDTEFSHASSWSNGQDDDRNKRSDPNPVTRRMRKQFSVIEVSNIDEDEKESKGKHFLWNRNAKSTEYRKSSTEVRLIENYEETKKPNYGKQHSGEDSIWGLNSNTIDSKNLHPGITELLLVAITGDNAKLEQIFEESISNRHSTVNLNSVDLLGRSGLHFAVYNNHFETARIFIAQGANVNLWDKEKKATPLICAAAIGAVELVELLLKNGADVNAGYDQGNTALLWAARIDNEELLRMLLEHGAAPNSLQMFSETALHVASERGNEKCVQLLLERGADVHLQKGEDRNTALYLAAREYNFNCCEMLLNHKARVDAQNSKGESALHIAALNSDSDLVHLLLGRGANVHLKDKEGRTALFYAIDKDLKAVESVEWLLKYKTDVNCQDGLGLTPLHIASLKKSKMCASLLVKYNANVALQSKSGASALSFMLRDIPDTMQYIRNRLDESVINMRETNDSSCKVRLDFKTVIPNGSWPPACPTKAGKMEDDQYESTSYRETELLKCFIQNDQENILLHPLIETFLALKWLKVRWFFYFAFLLKALLVLLFSYFMVKLFVGCPDKGIYYPDNENTTTTSSNLRTFLNDTTSYNSTNKAVEIFSKIYDSMSLKIFAATANQEQEPVIELAECFPPRHWIILWSAVLVLAALLIAEELIQLFQSFKTYILYLDSWIFWLFIITLCITCTFLPNDGINFEKRRWQPSFAAVSVFLAWIFILVQLGKFPSSGTLVQMFVKVFVNFGRFFAAYTCFLMAFALAFCILFPKEDPFRNPLLAFAKVTRMMTGDVNQEGQLFGVYKAMNNRPDQTATEYPWLAHILHFIFVVMVTIVLMNLLVGLAVADIQGMYRDARLHRLSRQAALIFHLESSFLSPTILNRIPATLADFMKRKMNVSPSYYNGLFNFRPYDNRDMRLPQYLKMSALKLASTSSAESRNTFCTTLTKDSISNVDTKYISALKNSEAKIIASMQTQMDSLIAKIESLSKELK